MSKSWIAPRWWPRDKDGYQIVGFKFSAWFLPELDQWCLGRMGNCTFSIGPLRIRTAWVGIHRKHR